MKNCGLRHLCILTVCTIPAGLLAQARPATGVFTGIVVDTARRPVSGVQVLLSGTRLVASTGADGRFQTSRITNGPQNLLFRRIGFRPRTLQIDLRAPEQALDTLTLEESPVLLPELGVAAKLTPPTFYLDSLGNLDDGVVLLGYHRYLGYGASMSTSHTFLALLQTPYRGYPPDAASRGYLSGRPDMEFAGRAYGRPCWKMARHLFLATALDEPPSTYRILTRDGLVFGGMMPDASSMGDCIQSISLSIPTPLAAASPTTRGWAVVSAKERDSARLHFVNLFGREVGAVRLREVLGREVASEAVALTASPRGTLVTMKQPPHLWVEVDVAGRPLLMGGPFDSTGKETKVDPAKFRGWVSYGVLPIDRGYVQQLEKPDRTVRLLILYDVLGRQSERRGPASQPVFIASLPEQRRLLGIHYIDPWGRNTRLYEYSY